MARFGRWLRYRFVVPIKRSRHPPQYTARSVAAGLFWAMTPTVGIQMMFVLAHWLAVRRFAPRWDFNLIHAMAWTWVTNFATVLPAYYAFYVTGQVVLGRWDDLTGYEGFTTLWDASTGGGGTTDYLPGAQSTPGLFLDVVVAGWGLAMLVGCPPYAIAAGWLGYTWALKIAVARRRRMTRKRLGRGARGRPAAGRTEDRDARSGGG